MFASEARAVILRAPDVVESARVWWCLALREWARVTVLEGGDPVCRREPDRGLRRKERRVP